MRGSLIDYFLYCPISPSLISCHKGIQKTMMFQMKIISSYFKMISMIFMELFPCITGSLLERIENHKKKLTVGSKRTRARTRVHTYKCLTVDT